MTITSINCIIDLLRKEIDDIQSNIDLIYGSWSNIQNRINGLEDELLKACNNNVLSDEYQKKKDALRNSNQIRMLIDDRNAIEEDLRKERSNKEYYQKTLNEFMTHQW